MPDATHPRVLLIGVLLGVAAQLAAQTAAPVVSSGSYSHVVEGSSDLVPVIDGSGFVPASVARFDASRLATTQLSSTRMVATVPASLVTKPEIYLLTVINPDGAVSVPINFLVTGIFPLITSLTPNVVAAGGAGFTLTIDGQNFRPAALVYLDGKVFGLTPASISRRASRWRFLHRW